MRHRHGAFALLALLPALFTAPAVAQVRNDGPPPIAFESFTLDNGLKFIVHEDRSTPVVAVNVWYDVGSAHEPPGRSGFAHLFEHMLFQETENLESGNFAELIRSAGGSYNGTTNRDRTAYFETLPSNRLGLALWLEAERMTRLRVTPENFDREREVVKEERRRNYENQPYAEGQLTLDTLITDWPPYDHPTIGSMEDLDAATVGDVRAFYERFYVPINATIVVAGDVSLAEVRDLAESYFAGIPRGPEPPSLPPPPTVPRTDGERRVTVDDDLANVPLFYAGFNIPPHDHPDTYALSLLSGIFSQGESSRLHRRLVVEERAAVAVIAGLDSRVGPGGFLFGALPNQGVEIDRIEALIAEEIERLKEEGVTERELRKAKNQHRASQIMGWQTVASKASSLQHYRLLHGDIAEIGTDLERYEAVTVDDIRRAAREYLAFENRTVVIVRPAQSGTAAAVGAGAGGTISTSTAREEGQAR